MKKVLLITGANGMVAKKLSEKLKSHYEIRYFSRNPKNKNEYLWNIEKRFLDESALREVDSIIHLAGANIAEKRWSKGRKEEIINSRVDSAQLIFDSLEKNSITIDSFITASAVGFYGAKTSDKIYIESDAKGDDYLSNVVYLWEKIADKFKDKKIAKRVVKLRTGVVLSKKEGALIKLSTPIKMGFGAALGSGRQYMPWIHIDDLVKMYIYCLENKQLTGTYNACSPEHISNLEFTQKVSSYLNKKLWLPNVPAFALKIALGEMALVLLEGSRCSATKIEKSGFIFEYPTLDKSLKNLLT